MQVTQDPHPLLYPLCFITEFPDAIGQLGNPQSWSELLKAEAEAPVKRSEDIRTAVRGVLRHGGHKPTGRGKPASEYLVRAAEEERLGPINLAVDACNIVSLQSGFPISVVDLDLAQAPFRLGVPEKGVSYVFNASGQEISVGGLLCLYDAEGPCANGVKDCQRTKTHAETRRTLTVMWGAHSHEDSVVAAYTWYSQLLAEVGAKVERLSVVESSAPAG